MLTPDLCPSNTADYVSHVVCDCEKYEFECAALTRDLARLDSRPLTVIKTLGAWSTPEKARKATMAKGLKIEQLIEQEIS